MNALIAAYCEGLALAAVAVIACADGPHIKTMMPQETLLSGESLVVRWWCRRAAEAECVADSAARSFRRSGQKSSDRSALASDAVIRAAQRFGVTLSTDADLEQEAGHAIARLDAEIAIQMRAGALKSVNQSYRQYRLEASSRGERVLPYAKWMDGYKQKLMREIAANLRYR
jgi:hypothetical protein